METYVIKYGMYLTTGWYQSGTIKVKNCLTSAHAKVKLEKYLRGKHTMFGKMAVYECVKEIPGTDGLPDFLKNIFYNL